jgi:hypothetical protein
MPGGAARRGGEEYTLVALTEGVDRRGAAANSNKLGDARPRRMEAISARLTPAYRVAHAAKNVSVAPKSVYTTLK